MITDSCLLLVNCDLSIDLVVSSLLLLLECFIDLLVTVRFLENSL